MAFCQMMCMSPAAAYVLNAEDGTCLPPKITLQLFPWLKTNEQKGKLVEYVPVALKNNVQ